MLSATRSRWGQRLGQEKAASENSNLRKAKVLEIRRFRGLLVRREGFEPPAFWSVGCLTHKSESFRLRFALFDAVRPANFPLFPSSPARSNPILGQKWVRERRNVGTSRFYTTNVDKRSKWSRSFSCPPYRNTATLPPLPNAAICHIPLGPFAIITKSKSE